MRSNFIPAVAVVLGTVAAQAGSYANISCLPDGDVVLENSALKVVIESKRGAVIRSFLDKRSGREEVYRSVGKDFGGLAEPRFGGTPGAKEYTTAPHKVKIISVRPDLKQAVLSYTPSSGANKGIESRVIYSLYADRAVIGVEWHLINHTRELRRITPWVRNTVAGYRDIGISMDTNNKTNTGDTSVPTEFGHIHKLASGGDFFIKPARNWFARVAKEHQDPANGTLFILFDYNSIFQLYMLHFKYIHCMEMIFAPVDIEAGKSANIRYQICSAGALKDVRFASSYAVADIERIDGKLRLSLSGTGNYGEVEAVLCGVDGKNTIKRKIELLQGKVVFADFPDVFGDFVELQLIKDGENLLKPEYDEQNICRMTATLNTIISTKAAYVDEPKVFKAWPRLTATFKDIEGRKLAVKYPLKSSVAALKAWAENSSERIFEDDVPEKMAEKIEPFELSAAGKERENFQIALFNSGKDELKNLTFRIRGWENTGIAYSWHPVEYVTTTQPSSFADYPVGKYPDVLLDPGSFAVPSKKNRCVWISFKIPSGMKGGNYPAIAEILKDGAVVAEIPLSLRVWSFDMPAISYFRTDVGGFFSKTAMMNMLKKDFGFTKTSSQLENELFEHMLSRRLNPRGYGVSCKNIDKFEKELVRRINMGVNTFFIPLNLSDKQRRAVEEVLKKHNVLKRSFVYAFDEIHAEQAPKVKKWCDNWHKKSEIPILVVYYGSPVEPLYGGIDIWCRMNNPDNRKLLTERVAAGDEVWFTNTPLFELEAPIIQGRQNVWECFTSGMTGCLLWSCAPLSKNPFKQPFRSGTNLHGVLYYPVAGKNGLVPSIRLETFADAVEDFDYLSMLKEAASEAEKRGADAGMVAEARKVLAMPIPQNSEELKARREMIGSLIEKLVKK